MSTLKKWLPSIFMMSVIFVLSSVQGATINQAGLGKEPIQINGHFILFVLLCLAFYKASKNSTKAVLYTVLYGIFDEIHQKYTPGRSSSVFDIFVDSTGAIIMGMILWKLQPYLPKILTNWLKK